MKLFLFCFLSFSLFGRSSFAQTFQHVLNIKDSTLGAYLDKKFEKKPNRFIDTCVEGFYSFAFSLSKRGEVVMFTTSKQLPKRVGDTLKSLLISLNHFWNDDFVKLVSNRSTLIVQPFYLSIFENCATKYKINFQSADDTTEIGALKEEASSWETLLKEKIDALVTFSDIYDFNDKKINLQNTYLLQPITLARRHERLSRKID